MWPSADISSSTGSFPAGIGVPTVPCVRSTGITRPWVVSSRYPLVPSGVVTMPSGEPGRVRLGPPFPPFRDCEARSAGPAWTTATALVGRAAAGAVDVGARERKRKTPTPPTRRAATTSTASSCLFVGKLFALPGTATGGGALPLTGGGASLEGASPDSAGGGSGGASGTADASHGLRARGARSRTLHVGVAPAAAATGSGTAEGSGGVATGGGVAPHFFGHVPTLSSGSPRPVARALRF